MPLQTPSSSTTNSDYGKFYGFRNSSIIVSEERSRRLGSRLNGRLSPTTNSEYGSFEDLHHEALVRHPAMTENRKTTLTTNAVYGSFEHLPQEQDKDMSLPIKESPTLFEWSIPPASKTNKQEAFDWTRQPMTDRSSDRYHPKSKIQEAFDWTRQPMTDRSNATSRRIRDIENDSNRDNEETTFRSTPRVKDTVGIFNGKTILPRIKPSDANNLPEVEAIELMMKDRSKLMLSLKEFYSRFVY